MRKRSLWVVLAATVMSLVMTVPASADEVEEPIFELFPDEENGVAVFWNITRDNFCDWADGGFEGPAPVEELVPATVFFQDSGVILGKYLNANRPIELWALDDDVPPLIGPCEDTDGQDSPFATGYAVGEGTDNDLPGETRRTNTFGTRGEGTVYDADGNAWSYSWLRHFQVKRGEFNVLAEESSLTPQ